jgi:hypothetical protein
MGLAIMLKNARRKQFLAWKQKTRRREGTCSDAIGTIVFYEKSVFHGESLGGSFQAGIRASRISNLSVVILLYRSFWAGREEL